MDNVVGGGSEGGGRSGGVWTGSSGGGSRISDGWGIQWQEAQTSELGIAGRSISDIRLGERGGGAKGPSLEVFTLFLSHSSFGPYVAGASGCLRGNFVTKDVIKHISSGMSITRYGHPPRENCLYRAASPIRESGGEDHLLKRKKKKRDYTARRFRVLGRPGHLHAAVGAHHRR